MKADVMWPIRGKTGHLKAKYEAMGKEGKEGRSLKVKRR